MSFDSFLKLLKRNSKEKLSGGEEIEQGGDVCAQMNKESSTCWSFTGKTAKASSTEVIVLNENEVIV